MPWTDAAGRFSAFKLLVFVLILAPALWLAWQASFDLLQANAMADAIHQSGDWSVRLLLIGLAITPLRQVAGWAPLMQVRRMLGVAALAYGLLHFALYIAQQNYLLSHVVNEIILRIYLTIGFGALLGLAALGITSTDGMIRRLGGRWWKRLHKWVYVLIPLAILHYFMQSKVDVSLPVIMAGLYVGLMALRLLPRLKLGPNPLPLLAVALFSALATMAIEAGWYVAATGVMAERVLLANLNWDLQPRPALWVAAAGVALVGIALLRPLWSRRRRSTVTAATRSSRLSADLPMPDAPRRPQTAQTPG